ncbi:hypothetical protein KAX06_01105 [candidate division WOR-3 bacterium]|nr:hypothetical protein [candidate division WOR-3 bacterium]MCK4333364.1 hypothetical protein [candidate division WOR-3 bacterium]
MKRIVLIVVIAVILCPLSMDAARRSKKTFPLMLGPKLSVGFFEGDESLYPVSFQGEAMLNLYKNQIWVRTNILELTAYENSNYLGLNMGSPIEGVFMGSYKDWRPYGFGGLGIGVTSIISDIGDITSSRVWITLGGGAAYVVSRYSHFFGEGGVDLSYFADDWDWRLFIGIGARFELYW